MPLSQSDFADDGDSVLLRAIKMQRWDECKALLYSQEADRLARQLDAFENTALHSALGYKAPDELLNRLLDLFPEATKQHGTDEWLPLHVAAMWGVSSSVLEALILANPAALDDPGEGGIKGRTPRHFSGRFPHNTELLEKSTTDWIALSQEVKRKRPKWDQE